MPLPVSGRPACGRKKPRTSLAAPRCRQSSLTRRVTSLGPLAEAHRLNPYSIDSAAWIGNYYCFLGEWERGSALLRESLELGPENPLSLMALALDHYRQGDFEAAWAMASRIHHSFQIWGHALRAASLGQLGRLEDAHWELTQAQRICPDLHGQGRELMRRVFYSDELVDHVFEGLDKTARDT